MAFKDKLKKGIKKAQGAFKKYVPAGKAYSAVRQGLAGRGGGGGPESPRAQAATLMRRKRPAGAGQIEFTSRQEEM